MLLPKMALSALEVGKRDGMVRRVSVCLTAAVLALLRLLVSDGGLVFGRKGCGDERDWFEAGGGSIVEPEGLWVTYWVDR